MARRKNGMNFKFLSKDVIEPELLKSSCEVVWSTENAPFKVYSKTVRTTNVLSLLQDSLAFFFGISNRASYTTSNNDYQS
jgi:hypothetical protein